MRSSTRYCIFSTLEGFADGFLLVTYALLLAQDVGLSYGEIAFVNVIFGIAVILAEIPTGVLADGKSRNFSLVSGCMTCAFGLMIFGFAQNIWHILIAEIIEAIGIAFFSGAKEAWLEERRDVNEKNIAKIRGMSSMSRTIAISISAMSAGILIELTGRREVYMLTVILYTVLTAFTATYMKDEACIQVKKNTGKQTFFKALKVIRENPKLLWLVAMRFNHGGYKGFNMYWSLLFAFMFGEAELGIMWFFMQSGLFLGGWIVQRFGYRQETLHIYILTSVAISYIAFMLIQENDSMMVIGALLIMHESPREIWQILVTTAIGQHDDVSNDIRATIHSMASTIRMVAESAIGLFIAAAFFGMNPDAVTIPALWTVIGCIGFATVAVLWLVRPKNL